MSLIRYQTPDASVLRSLDISLHDGVLTIGGERQDEVPEGDKATRTERFVGKFRRSISLPTRVNSIRTRSTPPTKMAC